MKKPKPNTGQIPQTLSVRRKHQLILALIVGLLGFGLYANTIGHDFVLDDYAVIKENAIVKEGLPGIPSLLRTGHLEGYWNISKDKFYRPLSLVMFAIEWQISPNNPTLHHVVHVLVYALTGFILFYTLSELLREYNLILPFMICLLFISHPIHTEVVANIKSRDLIMAFFFVILTFYLLQKYIRSHNLIFLILSLVCYFLALCSKEDAITIFAVIPLLIFMFSDLKIHINWAISALFVIPIAIYLTLRIDILETTIIDLSTIGIIVILALIPFLMSIFIIQIPRNLCITLLCLLMMTVVYLLLQMETSMPDSFSRIIVSIEIMGIYLLKLLYPHPLVFDASYNQYPYTSWYNIKVIISFLTYCGLGVFVIMRIKQKSVIAFGILYFMITMSIHIYSMFHMGLPYGERFLYISSFGFVLSIVFFLGLLLKTEMKYINYNNIFSAFRMNAFILSVTILIVALFSIKTIMRNIDWKTNTTLRTADVHKSPNSARMRYYYGLTLMEDKAVNAATKEERREFLQQAINEFLAAIKINEFMWEPYGQLGIAYFRLGDYSSALEYYKKAKLSSDVANNMGILYYKEGDYKRALYMFKMAVELEPKLANAYFNMGVIQGSLGDYQQAIDNLKRSIQYDAYHAPTYYHLGLVYQKIRDEENAQIQFHKADQLDPRLRK